MVGRLSDLHVIGLLVQRSLERCFFHTIFRLLLVLSLFGVARIIIISRRHDIVLVVAVIVIVCLVLIALFIISRIIVTPLSLTIIIVEYLQFFLDFVLLVTSSVFFGVGGILDRIGLITIIICLFILGFAGQELVQSLLVLGSIIISYFVVVATEHGLNVGFLVGGIGICLRWIVQSLIDLHL